MHAKEWKAEYETGIDRIDNQHRMFLGLINRLIEFEAGELQSISLERLLLEIEAYARFHFISEENLMKEIGYPGLEEQQRQHAQLAKQIGELLTSVRADEENIVDLHMRMLTWLIGHTVDSDKDIGRYAESIKA